jgi:glutamate racemase
MKSDAHNEARPIAVFDSGVGGLPYLSWLKRNLPGERFVYLADRANFPYGEKSEDELRGIIMDTVGRYISSQDPKIMIIACNTASVVALADLRARYDIPFIGVVPAVKPAAEMSQTRSIGILATRRTVQDPYTEGLISSFAPDCSVFRFAGVEIVDLVENHFFTTSAEEKRRVLEPAVDYFRQRNVDTVVVACTHFIFVQEELQRMMGEGTRMIDSRDGVGRQAIHILEERQLLERNGGRPMDGDNHVDGDYFFVTRVQDEGRYRRFAADFALQWGGAL